MVYFYYFNINQNENLVAQFFGKYDHEIISTSTHPDTFGVSRSGSIQQRDVLTANDVLRLQTGSFAQFLPNDYDSVRVAHIAPYHIPLDLIAQEIEMPSKNLNLETE